MDRAREPAVGRDVIEGRLIGIGLRAVELGVNVVIDFGLRSRDERSAVRRAAVDLGATVGVRYCGVIPTEQRRWLKRRQAEAPHTTWRMTDGELITWAALVDIPTLGKLDGGEDVDDPPDGVATWDEWRRHRWPPSPS